MSRSDVNSLEHVLLLIAAMDPRPWYPRVYARDYNVSLDELNDRLLVLWNEGLLVKADSGSSSTGAGLILSLAGKRLLDNPAGLQRLNAIRPRRSTGREQRPIREEEDDRELPEALPGGDTAMKVRATLTQPVKPFMTRLLVGLNVGVFLIGLMLANQGGGSDALSAFFMGPMLQQSAGANAASKAAWTETGSVNVHELLAGQWWRLLTCCFVHFGILHIGSNMYVLFSAGRNNEQIWGWWRFLIIYLCAGLGGSVLAMTILNRPTDLAGASGAICGIVAAELVWVIANGRHLPASMASRWRTGLFSNGLMIVLISVMPGVSWQGHLGGAIVGAVVAAILNFQRFGPAPWRWVVLAAFLLLPFAAWWGFQTARAQNQIWLNAEEDMKLREESKKQQAEAAETKERTGLRDRVRKAWEKADRDFDKARSQLDLNPKRRKKEEVEASIDRLEKDRLEMQLLSEELANPNKETNTERGVASDFLRNYAAFLQEAINCLKQEVDPLKVPEFGKLEAVVDEQRGLWRAIVKKNSK